MYEITLLDNLKQKIVGPDDELEEEQPTTIKGYQELITKKEEKTKREKTLLEQQIVRRDKLIDIQKERIARLKQEVDRAVNLMHKRVKPIKEILDEKMQHLSSLDILEPNRASKEYSSNPRVKAREMKEQCTQTKERFDNDDDEFHNFITSDEISEIVEARQEQVNNKKISDIKLYTKPQQPNRVNVHLNLVHFGKGDYLKSTNTTEEAVQRVAKKVLKNQQQQLMVVGGG